MGKFIPTGMQDKTEDENAWYVHLWAGSDTSLAGDSHRWIWANPTNRRFSHLYYDREAVSVECLWQGTKVFGPINEPNEVALAGDWRVVKGGRPRGAWAGPGEDLIDNVEQARRKILIPAYKYQIMSWVVSDDRAQELVQAARQHPGPVYLRDLETGQGVDNPVAMSYAWLLSVWLNTGRWPE